LCRDILPPHSFTDRGVHALRKEIMVTIYTRTTCAPCKTVKYWLKSKNVEYVEKNIDEGDNMQEFVKFTDMPMVPLILTDTGEKIQGLNLSLLSKVLMV
jgi:glutaredoxin